jgi:hypothetical protein
MLEYNIIILFCYLFLGIVTNQYLFLYLHQCSLLDGERMCQNEAFDMYTDCSYIFMLASSTTLLWLLFNILSSKRNLCKVIN